MPGGCAERQLSRARHAAHRQALRGCGTGIGIRVKRAQKSEESDFNLQSLIPPSSVLQSPRPRVSYSDESGVLAFVAEGIERAEAEPAL